MSPSPSGIIPTVDYERCQACRPCEAGQHCRFKAFMRIDRDEPPYIEVSLCEGCGDCAPHCPYKAVVPPKRMFPGMGNDA